MAAKKGAAKKGAAKREGVMEINDLGTMKVLTDPTRLAILESISDPSSVTEIAERLDVPRTRLYHHIKLLTDHNLIKVSQTRKKGALSEKLYEPTADSYAPGPDLLESEDAAERADAIVAGVLDTTREDLRRSIVKFGDELQRDGRQSMTLNRSLARLSLEESEELVEEMTKVWDRFRKLHDPEVKTEDTKLYAMTWLFYPSSRDGM